MVMTREERRAYNKLYREKNKEKLKASKSQYREKNKEKIKAYKSQYHQTEKSKKSNRINTWKHMGIIHDDYDVLYQRYLETNECEECGINMCFGLCADGRCVDHDHNTGKVRNILCRACNIRRG